MDLRCRKALSTGKTQLKCAEYYWVNGSEMPKGVEHSVDLKYTALEVRVNGSEMPKGVEHWTYAYVYPNKCAGEWI